MNKILLICILFFTFIEAKEKQYYWIFDKKEKCSIYDNYNPEKNIKVFWSGACKNKKANGYGIAVFTETVNGKTNEIFRYKGNIKNGKYDGPAFLRWAQSRAMGSFNFKDSIYEKEAYFLTKDKKEYVYGTYSNGKFKSKESIKNYSTNVDIQNRFKKEKKKIFQYNNILKEKLTKTCEYEEHLFKIKQNTFKEFSAISFTSLIKCYSEKGKYKKALALYNESLKFPKSKHKYFLRKTKKSLALIYFNLGDYKKSIGHLENLPQIYIDKKVFSLLESKHFNTYDNKRKKLIKKYKKILNERFIKAVEKSSKNIVKISLESGADVYFKDHKGKTAFVYALENENQEILSMILNYSNNINKSGTPYIVKVAHSKIINMKNRKINLLIDSGADVTAKDRNGNELLEILLKTRFFNLYPHSLLEMDILYKIVKNSSYKNKRFNINIKNVLKRNLVIKNGEIYSYKEYLCNKNNKCEDKPYTIIRRISKDRITNIKKGNSSEYYKGKLDGNSYQYDLKSKDAFLTKNYKNGFLLECERKYYDSNNKKYLKQLGSKTKYNYSTKLYDYISFNKNGTIFEKYSFKEENNFYCEVNSSNYIIGERLLYNSINKIILKEIYNNNGKVTFIKNNLVENKNKLIQSYINNDSKGLIYYILEMEEATGQKNVSKAKKFLDNLIFNIKKRVKLKSKYTKKEAIDIMNIIASEIKKTGIIYDDKHIDVLSKTIENLAMDCDIISLLYITIGDKLDLPIHSIFFPKHMAIIWDDGKVKFNWEATNHSFVKDVDIEETYLINMNIREMNIKTLKNHPYYGVKMSRKDTFLHALALQLISSDKEKEKNIYNDILYENNYYNSMFIPFHSKFEKTKQSKEIESEKTKYIKNIIDKRIKYYGNKDLYNLSILFSFVHNNVHSDTSKLYIKLYNIYKDSIKSYLLSLEKGSKKEHTFVKDGVLKFYSSYAIHIKGQGQIKKAIKIFNQIYKINKSKKILNLLKRYKKDLKNQ